MSFVTTRRFAALLTGLTLLAGACHKDHDPAPLTVTASTDTSVAPTLVPLAYKPPPPTKPLDATYAFDLDNAQVMPAPAGTTPLPAPWAAVATGAYSDDIRNDHKAADGWELVFSTFTTSFLYDHSYFILYNKYRGVLRLYYYYGAGFNPTLTGYKALASTFRLDGQQLAPTPLLNFAAQSVVDVAKNATAASLLDTQPYTNTSWYVAQYELAYDSAIGSKNYMNLSSKWQLNGSLLTGLTLNGISQTTLPGSLMVDSVDFVNTVNIDRSVNYSGRAQLTLTGPASLNSLQQNGLPADGARQVLALAAGAPWFRGEVPAQNGGLGAVALLPVQAKFYTKADLGLTDLFLTLPGYDNSQVVGQAPQYNAAPGVFYLQSRPVITKQTATTGAQPYGYTLDVASVKYLFNPAVQAVADIRNLRQEIIATAPGTGTGLDGTVYAGTTLAASQELTVQGVRVAFDVVPKNGSATVHITKTFRADVK